MLSVVIPTYRPQNFLRDTLQSINLAAQQLPQPINVYLCLNGKSSNNEVSHTIVPLTYQNIRITMVSSILTNNPAQSLNFAISQAKEKYVWIMCDDDTVEISSLKKITNILKKKHITIGMANFNTIDSNGKIITRNVQGWTQDQSFTAFDLDRSIHKSNFCYGSFSSLIINRNAWFTTDYFEKKAPGGMNFMLQAPQLMSMGTHTLIAEPLYNYRLYEKRWQQNYNETFHIDHVILPQLINLYSDFLISKKSIYHLRDSNNKGIIQSFYNLKMFGKPNFSLTVSTFKHNYLNRFFYQGLILIFIPKGFLKYIKKIRIAKKFRVRG